MRVEWCGEGEEVDVPILGGEGVGSIVYQDGGVLGEEDPVVWCCVCVLWVELGEVPWGVLVECSAGEVSEFVPCGAGVVEWWGEVGAGFYDA